MACEVDGAGREEEKEERGVCTGRRAVGSGSGGPGGLLLLWLIIVSYGLGPAPAAACAHSNSDICVVAVRLATRPDGCFMRCSRAGPRLGPGTETCAHAKQRPTSFMESVLGCDKGLVSGFRGLFQGLSDGAGSTGFSRSRYRYLRSRGGAPLERSALAHGSMLIGIFFPKRLARQRPLRDNTGGIFS
jgi:hypothetical protein